MAQEVDETVVSDSASYASDQVPTVQPDQAVPIVRRRAPLFGSRSPDEMVDLARARAADLVGVAIDEVQVLSLQPTEWSNLGLGCPMPGFRFGEITIPGYIIEVDAGGTLLTYHTDRGLRAIVCDGPPAAPSVE